MTQAMLNINSIAKAYNNTPVLTDVTATINEGEIYGLIGKNGSGKTTLLRIITGQIPNYKGNVIKKTKNTRISAVINTPALYLDMSAMQNLKMHSLLLDDCSVKDIQKALKLVGLENTGNKKVRDFSLGMTQRLKLAQALIETPDILILDEPINGLDPDGISELRQLILKLNAQRKLTIIISSHILSELENTASHIGILANGKIVFTASKNELKAQGKALEELYMQYTKGVTAQ